MKKSTIAVIVLLLLAACGFGGWKYHEAQIAKMQDAGVEALRAAVDLELYREEEQTAISKILDEKEAAIRECREQEAIDALLAEAPGEYADFKTDEQLTAEEEAARLAELERIRKEKEEEERRQAELAAQQAAAEAAASSKKSSGGSRNGCVGGGKDVFN